MGIVWFFVVCSTQRFLHIGSNVTAVVLVTLVIVRASWRALFAGALQELLQITSCRTLCGQFQLFTSAQTNPTPDL